MGEKLYKFLGQIGSGERSLPFGLLAFQNPRSDATSRNNGISTVLPAGTYQDPLQATETGCGMYQTLRYRDA